jgi:DNA repair exonuclease SbcCD ATPase subunit
MICPNCGIPMRELRNPRLGVVDYACPGCGLTKRERSSVAAERTEAAPPPPLPEPEKKKVTSVSRVQKRVKKAKQTTELRQALKELSGRLNDLDIQLDRRMEELQAAVVKLAQVIEQLDDS